MVVQRHSANNSLLLGNLLAGSYRQSSAALGSTEKRKAENVTAALRATDHLPHTRSSCAKSRTRHRSRFINFGLVALWRVRRCKPPRVVRCEQRTTTTQGYGVTKGA